MEKDKVTKLKRAALIAVLSTVPAITSSVIAYLEAKSVASTANAEVTEKAEAGYQVTRAAYEQMLKDIAELKAEVRLMNQFMLAGVSPASSGSEGVTSTDVETTSDEGDEGAEGSTEDTEPAARPERPEATARTFKVKKSKGDDYAVIKQSNLPEDLDMAQKALK